MRGIVYSRTAITNLQNLIEQGFERVGETVALEKAELLFRTVKDVLAKRPKVGKRIRQLRVYRYEISKTPFVVLYTFSDDTVYVYTVVHARSDIPQTDLGKVVW